MLKLTGSSILLVALTLDHTLASVSITNPKTQDWSTVGSAGFSAGMASHLSLASSPGGKVHLAYSDKANGDKATVKQFDGNKWVSIGGEGVTTSAAYYNSLKIGPSGEAYLAFQDFSKLRKTSVLKYNGSNWANVGTAGISSGAATHQSLVVDAQNKLYVAYSDYAANRRSTVLMNDGNDGWSVAGFSGFTGAPASYQSLAVNSSGHVYLAYQDGSNGSKATAMEFSNNKNWVTAGILGLSSGTVEYVSLAMSGSGLPLIAYSDAANGHRAAVKRYDGKAWVSVGQPDVSDGKASFLSLAIDSLGTPYLAFQDGANAERATIMKYSGVKWYPVGSAGFSNGKADFHSLAMISDIPHLAYRDHSVNGKATVVKMVDIYPVDVSENETVVTQVTATGVAPFSFSIVGGLDASQFLIDESSGQLSFVVAPDFESPAGSNLDNLYEVNVRVTDATGSSKTAAFRVLVTDVTELPMSVCGSNETAVWSFAGNPGFSDGAVSWSAVAFNSSKEPYAAYADSTVGNRVSVKRLQGSEWVTVGTNGFSPAAVLYVSLAIGLDDVPYVAYTDTTMVNRVAVMKFDGTSWVPVGPAVDGVTVNHNYVQLAFDAEGVLHVAYRASSLQNRATVRRFDGNSWVVVGSEGFTTTGAQWLSLAFDNTNAPLLAYSQASQIISSRHVSVVRFDGSSWSFVGTPAFALGERLSLAVDSNNVVYVAMRYMGSDGFMQPRVMRHFESNWTVVGEPISSIPVASISIELDSYDVPLLGLHLDMTGFREVSVHRFDSTNWINLGVLGKATPNINGAMSFGLDSKNTPYVFFRDEINNHRATVQRMSCAAE